MEEIINGIGFIKDKLDTRDYKFEEKLYGSTTLPEVVFKEIDLRLDECMPDTYESQGAVNSCVPYSWTKTLELQINRIFKKKFNTNGFKFNNALSKKFLYYVTRYITYSDQELIDSGASFRYTAKALMGNGICTQTLHNDMSAITSKPSFDALMNANEYKINAYYSVNSLQGILASLELGLPVQIGTDINGFDDAKVSTGFSAKSELWNATTPLRANHGMVIVGTTFKNNKWYFIIGNSYGKAWGDNGYCYIDAQKMWTYNIEQSMVIVVDTLAVDLDKENKYYFLSKELPNNSIVLGKYVFDLDYANDPVNAAEIGEKNILSNNIVFVKTASGDIINNTSNAIASLTDVIEAVGTRITYKNKLGEVIDLTLKF
jgi:hypothetical protein